MTCSAGGRITEAGGPFDVWSPLWRDPGMCQGSSSPGSCYVGLGWPLGRADEQALLLGWLRWSRTVAQLFSIIYK